MMKEGFTVANLQYSLWDDDGTETGRMDLIFGIGGKKFMASGRCPKESIDDDTYFDSQKNIDAFLYDADIEEKV